MLSEFWTHLTDWQPWDTWIVLTAAVAAMSCALPGVWLVLRRNSMMGDALAHSALPGIVLAILGLHVAQEWGWLTAGTARSIEPAVLIAGAVLIGLLTSILTEMVQKLGQVESSAALGVVFTTLFALGLFLMRLNADSTHIDADCVLFGQLELVVWDTVSVAGIQIPRALLSNGLALLINGALLLLAYKELRVSAFDAGFATSLGLSSRFIHYALMSATAMTVVMAYTTVGFILVIGLLIVPAATASLLTTRLDRLIWISLGVAVLSALLGHLFSLTVPPMVFGRLGFPTVEDAGTSGMMAATAGLLFLVTLLAAPGQGMVGRGVSRIQLTLQIRGDDVLGELYRREELGLASSVALNVDRSTPFKSLQHWLAVRRLQWHQWVQSSGSATSLTESGRLRARDLVRAHRLWETYMQKHFDVPDDHLHETADLVEHYLDDELRTRLADELDSPGTDPHGKSIP